MKSIGLSLLACHLGNQQRMVRLLGSLHAHPRLEEALVPGFSLAQWPLILLF